MLQFLPANPARLLDVGCGEGAFGKSVRDRFPNCEVWGAEISPAAADIAATRLHTVKRGDFLETAFPQDYFDVITMNDSLEHMVDTHAVLAKVRTLLKPGGALIVSFPNVRYYQNVRDLVFRNDWQYQDFGILDRTHYRFFTSKSAVRTLSECGFKVELVEGLPHPIRLHYRILFAALPRLFYWMRFPQFAVRAVLSR
jgi:ubiquinone/menaquinone biosynthesis C-methylase UbiE